MRAPRPRPPRPTAGPGGWGAARSYTSTNLRTSPRNSCGTAAKRWAAQAHRWLSALQGGPAMPLEGGALEATTCYALRHGRERCSGPGRRDHPGDMPRGSCVWKANAARSAHPHPGRGSRHKRRWGWRRAPFREWARRWLPSPGCASRLPCGPRRRTGFRVNPAPA